MSTTTLLALASPFVIYLLALVAYYVLDGRRERRRRQVSEEATSDG